MAFDPLAAQSELFALEQPGQQAPAKKPGFDRAKLMRLIPLVAAAAKGGPGALEGLLQGYQQAEVQRQQQATQQQQTDRQSRMDQSVLDERAFNQQYRTDELAQKQADARAALMGDFTKASVDLDNAADVRALAEQYEEQGRPLGMRPGTFTTKAMVTLTPSTLEKRAATKKLNALRQQFGTSWMEQAAKFTHVVNGRTVPFTELLAMGGMAPDPAAPQQAPQSIAADVPLDRQHAMALAAGNTELAGLIERSMTQQDKAKSQPFDPQLAELNRQIAEQRLDTLRRNAGGGGGRRMLSSDANRIAEIRTSLDDVEVLKREIGQTGAASRVGAMLPNVVSEMTGVGVDAKRRQAVIDRVKQVIGKALEGGVLRKEDEYKYVRILPTIGDPPDVARSKIAGLEAALQQRLQTTLETLSDAGYDVARIAARSGDAIAPVPSHAPSAPKQRIGRFEIEVVP